jgi:hypothetical protein
VSYKPYPAPPRRRSWLITLPLAIVVVLAVLWTGFWYYASATAQTMLDDWKVREAKLGRIYTCSSQAIEGFPFRLEVRCTAPNAELRSYQPPFAIKAQDLTAAVQIYDPTLLIADIASPFAIGDPGRDPLWRATWTRAQASFRGTPLAPQRVSSVFDNVALTRSGGAEPALAKADHLEVHGRMVGGSISDNPVVEVSARFTSASAPILHPMAAQPASGEADAVIWGLKDLSPRPLVAQLREIQAAGGHIDIKQARVQQGESIVVGEGTLALSQSGRLDGQIKLTVVGLERILAGLNLDRIVSQALSQQQIDKIAPGVDVNKLSQGLDRILPGLGGAVRNNPGVIAAVGISALGQTAVLDGKPAVTLPLRFSDGMAFLGPVPLGQTPSLF